MERSQLARPALECRVLLCLLGTRREVQHLLYLQPAPTFQQKAAVCSFPVLCSRSGKKAGVEALQQKTVMTQDLSA